MCPAVTLFFGDRVIEKVGFALEIGCHAVDVSSE